VWRLRPSDATPTWRLALEQAIAFGNYGHNGHNYRAEKGPIKMKILETLDIAGRGTA